MFLLDVMLCVCVYVTVYQNLKMEERIGKYVTEFSSLLERKEFTRVSSCRCKDIIVEDDKRSNDSVRFFIFSLIHRICVARARILLLLLPEEEEEKERR